jgi:hypothetical protein
MTLHVYNDLVQGSEEWLAARRGIVTASVVGQLITPKTIKPASNDYSRALTLLLAAERITGWSDPVYVTDDMMRGTLDEPVARALYAEHYAPVTETGLMVRDDWGYPIGYSPDGLVGDDGLIEIKSRRPKKHLATILADKPPLENLAQMHTGMLVADRQWCDYVSFCGGMALWVGRVHRDPRWDDAIIAAVELAEEAIGNAVRDYQTESAGLPATERNTYDAEIRF